MAQSKAFADASHALNDLSHALALLEAENDKLRTLCEDMLDYSRGAGFDNMAEWFRDRIDALRLVG